MPHLRQTNCHPERNEGSVPRVTVPGMREILLGEIPANANDYRARLTNCGDDRKEWSVPTVTLGHPPLSWVIPDIFYRESILPFLGWIPANNLRG